MSLRRCYPALLFRKRFYLESKVLAACTNHSNGQGNLRIIITLQFFYSSKNCPSEYSWSRNASDFFLSVMEKKTRASSSARAGIHFPAGRIRSNLRRLNPSAHISPTASIYLGAVLEYLCAELLELSGYVTKDTKVKRIAPRHIRIALDGDEELVKLCPRAIMPSAGVLPRIHAVFEKETPKVS
jgi:histone H2A